MTNRRTFLQFCTAMIAGTVLAPVKPAMAKHRCHPKGPRGPHPTPRTGITAAKVATNEQLHDAKLAPLFDAVRESPAVIDGIRCNCGCANSPGFYSLLTCYEGSAAMAQHCPICQGQGKLATRLHKAGKSLDEIRVAIDAQFGD